MSNILIPELPGIEVVGNLRNSILRAVVAVALTVDLDLPLVLDDCAGGGSSGHLHVLGPAGQQLPLVRLGRDEDDRRRRHVAVGAHLDVGRKEEGKAQSGND